MPTFRIIEAELIVDPLQKSGYSYFLMEEMLSVDNPENIKAYARGLRAMGKANGFGHYVLYAEEVADGKKKGITINFYNDLPDVAKEIYDTSIIRTHRLIDEIHERGQQ